MDMNTHPIHVKYIVALHFRHRRIKFKLSYNALSYIIYYKQVQLRHLDFKRIS